MNGGQQDFDSYVICLSKLENQSGTTDANILKTQHWNQPQGPYWAMESKVLSISINLTTWKWYIDVYCVFPDGCKVSTFFSHWISVNLLRCWFDYWKKLSPQSRFAKVSHFETTFCRETVLLSGGGPKLRHPRVPEKVFSETEGVDYLGAKQDWFASCRHLKGCKIFSNLCFIFWPVAVPLAYTHATHAWGIFSKLQATHKTELHPEEKLSITVYWDMWLVIWLVFFAADCIKPQCLGILGSRQHGVMFGAASTFS